MSAKDAARQAARRYRDRGWSVIPLKGKTPAGPWQRFQQEAMSAEELERRDWPGVGIVTGKVSGVIVLDADSAAAREALDKRGHPVTPMAKTARGMHVYFKHPGGELPNRIGLGDGLDLKGDGGYVVAPPSRHPTGAKYEWIVPPEDAAPAEMPSWLLEQLQRRQRNGHAKPVGERIPSGHRNQELTSIAGTLRRKGLGEAEILAALKETNKGRCQPPLDAGEVAKIAASVARYDPPPKASGPVANGAGHKKAEVAPRHEVPTDFNLTDLGNAERLVARHGHDLRYCHPWAKWLVWDSTRWCPDDTGKVERLAKETIRSIYVEAGNESDDARRRALIEHARRSEARSRIEATIALARSEPGIPVQPDDLDTAPWLLNATNGTLDLRTCELRPHDRADLITKVAGTGWYPDADAPRFAQFLREVLVEDDVIEFVQRFAGYSLTGNTRERVFAILHGSGKNGKSTLVELLHDVLGDYATDTDTETILQRKYSGVGNDVAALKGARFVSAAEVEQGRALAESKIKKLTGRDTVTARFLFAEPFNFRPEFKLWLSTNNKPVIHGTDDAIWDRIRMVPFTQRFEGARADASLPEKLRDELPGVLAWMVEGCTYWQRDGLGEPDAVSKATSAYRAEMDTLAAFIDEECIERPTAWCKFADLYAAYTRWCEESHEQREKKRRFGTMLTERGYERDNGTDNVAIRRGIALRYDGGPDPSRINEATPETPPASHDKPPNQAENVNPINERAENVNSQNPCKTQDSQRVIKEINAEVETFEVNPPRSEEFENTLIDDNSLIPEAEKAPSNTRRDERLTDEEVQRVRELEHQGTKAEIARREVLSKRRKK